MIKVLDWITKKPFYRLLFLSIAVCFTVAVFEGAAYGLAGGYTILLLFFIAYANFSDPY